jgi:hypothetical protein
MEGDAMTRRRREPHRLPPTRPLPLPRITVSDDMLEAYRAVRNVAWHCRCSTKSPGPCKACVAGAQGEATLRRLFGLEPWEEVVTDHLEGSAVWHRASYARFLALEHALRLARQKSRATSTPAKNADLKKPIDSVEA